jgi:glucosamine--fructose-6-phosphate aminotransferase (isomerizing)
MAQEALEAPEAAARFLNRNAGGLADLGRRLRAAPPPVVLTSARGSSDNAAAYCKYLVEIVLGIPCCSIGASVVSVYGATLKVRNALCLTVSQSGQSPDIVALQQAARSAGALTVAIVNDTDSPVARSAEICLGLEAGSERSVAATKSFITSLVAGAAITAQWAGDRHLAAAVEELPATLDRAARLTWPAVADLVAGVESLYVLGRGPALPIAQEAALKFKETCAIHAEAYSVAEVMHGPLELLGEGFPVLAFVPDDAANPSTRAAVERMRRTGANIAVIGSGSIPYVQAAHPLLEPVSMIQTAYLAIEGAARHRGRDPDRPRLLKKVTETM